MPSDDDAVVNLIRMQVYGRKHGIASSDEQQAGKGQDDDADSDSTTSGSSADLVGKANGAGGDSLSSTEKHHAVDSNPAANDNSATAFDTTAIKNKLSVKRPPGGKVCTACCLNAMHIVILCTSHLSIVLFMSWAVIL